MFKLGKRESKDTFGKCTVINSFVDSDSDDGLFNLFIFNYQKSVKEITTDPKKNVIKIRILRR